MPEFISLDRMLAELKAYRAIGTIQEFRELKADVYPIEQLKAPLITQGQHIFIVIDHPNAPIVFECVIDQILGGGNVFHCVGAYENGVWFNKTEIGKSVFLSDKAAINEIIRRHRT